jgi:deoxyribodipyrimidine photo-lyase
MDKTRVRILKNAEQGTGPVVYWMQRDQRANDNWALLYAQEVALRTDNPLVVVFNLVDSFSGARPEHFLFMRKALLETAQILESRNIPFLLRNGPPEESIPAFLADCGASLLVTDFNPLRIIREWKTAIGKKISIPFHEVDAHNIVPAFVASAKAEYGAHTLRRKLKLLLPVYLPDFDELKSMKNFYSGFMRADRTIFPGSSGNPLQTPGPHLPAPGTSAGLAVLDGFINTRLAGYELKRNDPVDDHQSRLSPYLHFGQISAQRVALEVARANVGEENKSAFLEELVVRRELADNFCFYNPQYDSTTGFPAWSRKSLGEHVNDRREYLYTLNQFEAGETHDELWNAAQRQMKRTGRMHGYLRMYWCKKILEWSACADLAMQTAITVNDRYALDGRDPNGYAGIAWAIGGVHDRPWFEHAVFGKIRYMNANGCARKFDVNAYIAENPQA